MKKFLQAALLEFFSKMLIPALGANIRFPKAYLFQFRTLCYEHWLRLGTDEVLYLHCEQKQIIYAKQIAQKITREKVINFKMSLSALFTMPKCI